MEVGAARRLPSFGFCLVLIQVAAAIFYFYENINKDGIEQNLNSPFKFCSEIRKVYGATLDAIASAIS